MRPLKSDVVEGHDHRRLRARAGRQRHNLRRRALRAFWQLGRQVGGQRACVSRRTYRPARRGRSQAMYVRFDLFPFLIRFLISPF